MQLPAQGSTRDLRTVEEYVLVLGSHGRQAMNDDMKQWEKGGKSAKLAFGGTALKGWVGTDERLIGMLMMMLIMLMMMMMMMMMI